MRIIQREGNSCPPGAKYYICPRFEGCCEVDACKVGTCPRQYIPTGGPGTTVAAVAPPVMVSEAPERSSTISSPRGITTYFSVASTDGGAWYTDTKTAPAPASSEAITSLASPSSSVVEVPSSSSSAPKAENENKELSAAAKGGIFGAIAALVLALVVGYFICRKKSRARKLRSHDSTSSFDRDEGKDGVDEDDAHPPMTAIPSRNGVHSSDDKETLRPEDVGAPLRGRYEEPQSRFNRESALNSNSRMMNHPISRSSRDLDVPKRPSAVIARSATASPQSALCEVPSAVKPTATVASPSISGPTALHPTSEMIARCTSASPDLMSRLGAATPELHGPPQQAAIAELASPGLPKVVQIHSSRSGVQKYKPYRPNANSLYPVAETTPSYLTGTLAATDEQSKKEYVNSWSKYDSAT